MENAALRAAVKVSSQLSRTRSADTRTAQVLEVPALLAMLPGGSSFGAPQAALRHGSSLRCGIASEIALTRAGTSPSDP